MNISLRFRLGMVLALAALVAGCEGPCKPIESINGPALTGNGVDLSTYVAVGTSLTSGYMSGGLVNRHQVRSFPALFAGQIGKTLQSDGKGAFTFPAIDGDGIPALTEIKSYSPLIINNSGRQLGSPVNITQPSAYHNLGVPGAILLDLADSTHYHATVPPVNRTNFTYWDIIQRRRGTILAQALSLQPTILSVEYGANEILGFATAGAAAPVGIGGQFAAGLSQVLDAIHALAPNTRLAVFNVPDVTSIPFFTTFPAGTVNLSSGLPVPLVGVDGALGVGDLVLLTAGSLIAQGYGIPAGGYNFVNPAAGSNGQPLPESVILRSPEATQTKNEISAMNAAVRTAAQRSYVAEVDLHGVLQDIAINGYLLGSNLYTTDFVTGGVFGLDGVHPNDFGYALMANTLIQAVNGKYGCAIPSVNLTFAGSPDASSAKPSNEPVYPSDLGELNVTFDMLFPYRR